MGLVHSTTVATFHPGAVRIAPVDSKAAVANKAPSMIFHGAFFDPVPGLKG